jgi:organic radical activating enzyme
MEQQAKMLRGERPEECHMCWHMEDVGAPSDRYTKSIIWAKEIPTLKADIDYVPKLIEVVFDNTCNLTCSYCDSGQSSAWAAKVKNDPLLLETDYRDLYSKVHIKPGHYDPVFFDAWQRWWPTIKHQVETIKVSGGEPLLSKNFWTFIESIDSAPDLKFEINSNLSVPRKVLQRLAQHADKFKSITIAASIDASKDIAEWCRQGLDFRQFERNVEYWCEQTLGNCLIKFQATVNIFSVWGIRDFINFAATVGSAWDERNEDVYATVVRFPEFQSVLMLPKEIRSTLSMDLASFIIDGDITFSDREMVYLNKLLKYLDSDPEPMVKLPQEQLERDLIKFLDWYDTEEVYREIFPELFVEWLDSIRERM